MQSNTALSPKQNKAVYEMSLNKHYCASASINNTDADSTDEIAKENKFNIPRRWTWSS